VGKREGGHVVVGAYPSFREGSRPRCGEGRRGGERQQKKRGGKEEPNCGKANLLISSRKICKMGEKGTTTTITEKNGQKGGKIKTTTLKTENRQSSV